MVWDISTRKRVPPISRRSQPSTCCGRPLKSSRVSYLSSAAVACYSFHWTMVRPPRQRRWRSWHPEVHGGSHPQPGHGAPAEGESGASPWKLGGSRGTVEGGYGVCKKCHRDVVLCCEAGEAVDEGAKKSEQGKEGSPGCNWKRPGESSCVL